MAEFIQEFSPWALFVVIFYLALQVVIPVLTSGALMFFFFISVTVQYVV